MASASPGLGLLGSIRGSIGGDTLNLDPGWLLRSWTRGFQPLVGAVGDEMPARIDIGLSGLLATQWAKSPLSEALGQGAFSPLSAP